MKLKVEIPFALRRVGIERVSDNLLANEEIGGINDDFIRIWRPEIEAKFFGWGNASLPKQDQPK